MKRNQEPEPGLARAASRAALAAMAASWLLSGGPLLPAQGLSTGHPGATQAETERFLGRWCLDCHAGAEREAELDLEPLAKQDPSAAEALWLRALARIERREMPPRSAERPSTGEAAAFTTGLRSRLASAYDPALPIPATPCRVTRLTRAQIANRLVDCFGVLPEELGNWPDDPVAHGFDHLTESLAVDERTLDRSFELAEALVAVCLPLAVEECRIDTEAPASDLKGGDSARGQRGLYSTGKVTWRMDLPRAGRYRLSVQAFAQQAGPDLAKTVLSAGDAKSAPLEVASEAAPGDSLQFEFEAPAGSSLLAASFVNDYFVPAAESKSGRAEDRNLYLGTFHLTGPLDEAPATAFERRAARLAGLPERGSSEGLEAARDALLAALSEELWRGQGRPEELQAILELARARGARAGLRDGIVALLVSPWFLFETEAVEPAPTAARSAPLAPERLLTRLSLWLHDTPPDQALLAAARPGLGADPEAVSSLAARMLDDPRTDRFVRAFAEQWLGLRALSKRTLDPRRWPAAPPGLLESMAVEPVLLFGAVLREQRPARQLLDANFTFVDPLLAAWYGLPPPHGKGFERVSLSDTQRRGLLTQASILTLTSDPGRTTPVKRGKWVLETLLGSPPPPPPPGVGALTEPASGEAPKSLRERLELHRSKRNCAACHARLDPFGLALEGFDALGRERELEFGLPIDTAAELYDGRRVRGSLELVEALAAGGTDPLEPSFERGLAESMATYALARGLTPEDRPLIGELIQIARQGNLRDMILAIARSSAFRERLSPSAPR